MDHARGKSRKNVKSMMLSTVIFRVLCWQPVLLRITGRAVVSWCVFVLAVNQVHMHNS